MPKRKITRELNRIKIVLEEQGKTQAWLAERLKINYVSINRWANNAAQPRLEILFEIARHLRISTRELIND